MLVDTLELTKDINMTIRFCTGLTLKDWVKVLACWIHFSFILYWMRREIGEVAMRIIAIVEIYLLP